METTNGEKLIKQLYVEFKKINKPNGHFKAAFVFAIYSVVKEYEV